jgi:hypothetical protein
MNQKISENKFKYTNVMETPEDTLLSILEGLGYLENEANAAGFKRLSKTIKNIREKPCAWDNANSNDINLDNKGETNV